MKKVSILRFSQGGHGLKTTITLKPEVDWQTCTNGLKINMTSSLRYDKDAIESITLSEVKVKKLRDYLNQLDLED